MKNQVLTAKEFAKVATAAQNEVVTTFKSPFIIINMLNKFVAGDLNKISGCNSLSRENTKVVANHVKKLHKGRYAFDFEVLPKSRYNKRLGYFVPTPNQQHELSNILTGEIVLSTAAGTIGKELCVQQAENGDYIVGVFKPIALTVPAVFAAFKRLVTNNLREGEKAEKQAAKAAKQAEKQAAKLAKAKAAVEAVFGKGLACQFTESEILTKYAAIKGAK